jgi:N-6 DNA Methylase
MRRQPFTTIRTEGGLFPPDFLQRLTEASSTVPGLGPEAYHLAGKEKLHEAASRAWNRLLGIWKVFYATNITAGDPGTTTTREKWLLPLFGELGYGRLQQARAVEVNGRNYPVSHVWQNVPIHLVGRNIDLDHRTAGVAGAARTSPHSLVQELLNRREESQWGFVSNGLKLRLLRDNRSLTRQAYVEFDLVVMMEGQAFSDFVLLWLMCHQSRVESMPPEACWLERWATEAREQGTRALNELRKGVKQAIESLGRGFLKHPANKLLLDKLHAGFLDRQDYYRQLLRVVYRLIFLFVAEDRELLLVAETGSRAAEQYSRFYSIARLRILASSRRGTPHGDLWQSLQIVMRGLASTHGIPELGLPALGSFLWSNSAAPDLDQCQLANSALLGSVRALAFHAEGDIRRRVDWRNLGSEELGSVYESLLELHPVLNSAAATFDLNEAAGSERKETGSYYTPTSLVDCLLDSALDPVLDEAAKEPDAERAILHLKVCDPACGSGHFLIAAAHRIARRLAAVRTGDAEASPDAVRHALRDVIGHCVYGVDVNEMAVELCKVNLWLEALDPGRPLSFLDQRIQYGNSLLGATPTLLRAGIPEAAFDPIEGDDPEQCRLLKRSNRREREGFQSLVNAESWERVGDLARGMAALEEIDDSTLDGVHQRETRYAEIVHSTSYECGRLWADSWCAAFVWPKTKDAHSLTEDMFRIIERNPMAAPEAMRNDIRQIAKQYRFFHWHLAFPEVFHVPSSDQPVPEGPGWTGGFDVVLGNPPWEHVELKEIEWFAARSPAIAEASNAAARKRMIKALAEDEPALHAAFLADLRSIDGERHIMRDSGLYPLCGTGRINTYAIFSELNRRLINPIGRTGFIVPSGIATDDTTKFFFRDLVERRSLVSLYDFENRLGLFPGVHRSYKFCLLTLAGGAVPAKEAHFVFFALQVENLREDNRQFTLNAEDFARLNPNSRTCPIFRTRRDAELTKLVYARVPILWQDDPQQNSWDLEFRQGLFNLSSDSHHFRTALQLKAEGYELKGNIFSSAFDRYLPLYEAKMHHQFDHRWCTYKDAEETIDLTPNEKADPSFFALPRNWVREEIFESVTPHFPELLYLAVALQETNSVRRFLHLWSAGDAFNREQPNDARQLIRSAPEFDRGSQVASSLDRLDIESWATELARRFPLTYEDRVRIKNSSSDWIAIGHELLARFSPRWFIGWRDICRSTDERTLIAAVLPRVAIGNSTQLVLRRGDQSAELALLLANFSSFACDYFVRQKIGGTHINHQIMKQFPIFPPKFYREPQRWQSAGETFGDWVRSRVLELTYTAHDLRAFAEDCGWDGPPFPWDEERRRILRAELDAAYLHAYGLNRDDAGYILSATNFPIAVAKQPQLFAAILSVFDSMAEAIQTGVPYRAHFSVSTIESSTP